MQEKLEEQEQQNRNKVKLDLVEKIIRKYGEDVKK